MKTNLTKIFTTIIATAVLAVGVSYVSAYTNSIPVPAIFNTGTNDQIKNGPLMSEKFMASDLGFFTRTLLPGSDSWVNIGGPLSLITSPTSTTGNFTLTNSGGNAPLTIHLNGRTTSTKEKVNGVDATRFVSQNICSPVGIVSNRAPAFVFASTTNPGGNADLIARQIKLSGGTPQNNSVLAAINNQGDAVWATLTVENGQIKIIENQTGSPVLNDVTCTTPPPPPPPPTVQYIWKTGEYVCGSSLAKSWKPVNAPAGADRLHCGTYLSDINPVNTKTRTVQCINSSTNVVVNDSLCDITKKPVSTISATDCPLPEFRFVETYTIKGITPQFDQVVSVQTLPTNTCFYRDTSAQNFEDQCRQSLTTEPRPTKLKPNSALGQIRPVTSCEYSWDPQQILGDTGTYIYNPNHVKVRQLEMFY